MANEIETIDSPNDEKFDLSEIDTIEDVETLRTKVKEFVPKLTDSNKQLFARAKKAEGFEFKDGKWVKPPKEEQPTVEKHPENPQAKPVDVDYGQLAFHNSKTGSVKIESSEDIEFLKQQMDETGKSQQAILNSKWFASELKEVQEARASANALPKGSKRTAQPVAQDEAYWMAKMESGQANLEDIPDVAMRRKVLNKRIEKEKSGHKFSANPIIQG